MIDTVHILAPGTIGGMGRVVEMLATAQKRAGGHPTVVAVLTQDSDEPSFITSLEASGVGVELIVARHRAYRQELRAVRAAVRRLQPSVVHTHGYHADVLLAWVNQGMDAALVSTAHGFTGGGRKNRFYEWLQVRAYRRFDAVVAVASQIVERLNSSGVPPDRVHVIRNAWTDEVALLSRKTAREILGLEPDAFVLGWVGRLGGEKGPDVAVKALAGLKNLPVQLSFVGEGRMLERLRATARAAGTHEQIRWHGRDPVAARLYSAFDVFLLTSRTEGTPIVLFEAMAARVPIVATAVGGVPDVVRHEVEALLVPSEDPMAIADAVRRVSTEPVESRNRAEAAARRLQVEFAPGPWVERYERVYEGVVRTGHRDGQAGR